MTTFESAKTSRQRTQILGGDRTGSTPPHTLLAGGRWWCSGRPASPLAPEKWDNIVELLWNLAGHNLLTPRIPSPIPRYCTAVTGWEWGGRGGGGGGERGNSAGGGGGIGAKAVSNPTRYIICSVICSMTGWEWEGKGGWGRGEGKRRKLYQTQPATQSVMLSVLWRLGSERENGGWGRGERAGKGTKAVSNPTRDTICYAICSVLPVQCRSKSLNRNE